MGIAIAELGTGELLQTARVLAALARVDVRGDWDRIWLQTGALDFVDRARAFRDTVGGGTRTAARYRGHPLTPATELALRRLAAMAIGSEPSTPGELALVLVAEPDSGAARALLAPGEVTHSQLLELVQSELLDVTLEGFADFLDATRGPVVPGAAGTADCPPGQLMALLLQFAAIPDLRHARRLLEANAKLLLSPEADAALEIQLASGREAGHDEMVEAIERRQQLLRRCREIGIADAFVEAAVDIDTEVVVSDEAQEMATLLLEFVTAPSREASKRVLLANREKLLSDMADGALGVFIEGAETAGDNAAELLQRSRQLLRRCRAIGIDAAFAESEGSRQEVVDMTMPVDLLSQVLAMVEQPNWASVRGYVSAHPELLSPATDAALDVVVTAARQGNAPRMRRLLDGLEGLRRTLRRSRDAGVDAAFKEATEAGAYEVAALLPAEFSLMAMLFGFVGAQTWTESRRIVELHPELLEERTDAVLDQMVAGIEADDGSAEAVAMLRNHQELLRQCRLVGTPAAFEGLTAPAERDPLLEAIAAFLASPTPRLAQQQLAEHSEIVSPRGVEVLEKLVERTGRVVPPDVAETMRARLTLLRRCVAVGVEAAFVEETGGRLHASELDALLTDLLSTGGRDDVARLLRDHPDLLRDESGQAMAELRAAALRDDDADTLAALDWLAEMRRVAETRTPQVPEATDPAEIALLPTVHAFVAADSWSASRRIVDEHPELLDDVADRVLARLEREARDERQGDFAEMLATHRRLLRRCREVGARQAFAELGRGGDDPSAAEVERMLREALDELTENGAPEQALIEQLGRTGYFLYERHQATGAAEDLDAAVRCLEDVARRVDRDDDSYAHHQHFRGKLLTTRYARTHQPGDIAAAAQAFRQAVDALPSGSPALPPTLTDLGHALLDLHKHTGEPGPLDDALDAYRKAIAAGPDPTDLAGALGNLSEALKARLDREHSAVDEDEMIDTLRWAAAAAERNTPMGFDLSNNLGIALEERFESRGDVADIDEAIRVFDTTLPLLRDNPAELAIHRGGRGNAWRRRHRHDRARASIDHAVDDYRAAAAAAPALADHGTHRLSLANALIDRFHLLGALSDLDEAIDTYRTAAPLLPQHDDRHPGLLTSLANAHAERWDTAGEWPDLEAALRTQQEAVERTVRGSPDWPGHLSTLGNRYLARFDAVGDPADLDSAIRHHDEAVAATPSDSEEYPRHLNNLAVALRTRYDRTGDAADLDRAAQASGHAVMVAPAGGDDLAGLLATWASALIARYRRFGRLPDLETANGALRRAHDVAGRSPRDAIIAANLANALRARYDNTREAADLDEAIRLHEHSLAGRLNLGDQQLHRSGLAAALSDRYDRDKNREDLTRAVELQRDLLNQLQPTAPNRGGHCANLGGELVKLYDLNGDAGVLAEALAFCEEAVQLTPQTSTLLPGLLVNLGQAQRRSGDAETAAVTLRTACRRAADTDPRTVLVASQVWGAWAGERQAWQEASQAYRYGLDAVRRLIGAEASRADKEIWLRGTRKVATGLAAALSMSDDPREAVVALERGRAMLLAEMLHERGAESASFALDEPTSRSWAAVAVVALSVGPSRTASRTAVQEVRPGSSAATKE